MNNLKKKVKNVKNKFKPKEEKKFKNPDEPMGSEKVINIVENANNFTENIDPFNEKPGRSKKVTNKTLSTFWNFTDEPPVELKYSEVISQNFLPSSIIDCPSIKHAYDLLSKVDFHYNSPALLKSCSVAFKIKEEFCDENVDNFKSIFNDISFPFVVVLESQMFGAVVVFWKLMSMTTCHSIKMFEREIKEAKKFIVDFIIKSVDDDHRAISTNFIQNSNYINNIATLVDFRDYNMLMLAAESGNLEVVEQLLSIGISVDLSVNELIAADLAWENQNQDVLLALLKSNSKYPKNFAIAKTFNDLASFTNDVIKFFKDLEKNEIEKIQEFLTNNSNLRYIFNTNNVSAAAMAIYLKKFDIYEILLDHNVMMAPLEEMGDITSDFKDSELTILKEIHQKSAKEDPEKHIKILTAFSKTGHDEQKIEERMKIIEEAYRALNNIPSVQPLLKAVAECRGATIYFDFNRVWVNYMDPSLSAGTNGAFYKSGRVYIAAKDLLDSKKRIEALSIIAHELCHFSINLGLKNNAKPYDKKDEQAIRFFDEICEEYKNLKSLEKVIKEVFDFYEAYMYHAELIVRVPQLMVLYNEQPEILEKCQKEYSKLFEYYSDVILPKVQESISSVENFLEDQLKQLNQKLKTYKKEILIKDEKLNDMEEEIEKYNTLYGRVGVSNCFNKDGPVHIMEIRDVDGKKEFYNNKNAINNILLQPEVEDRKIVVVSIIGEHRKGKSFFLDFCLRFMYAHYRSVSKPMISSSTNWMGKSNEPLKGFSWKYGCTADTKGILFWPDVFLYDEASGIKIAIILMDTQGLFEPNSSFQENARIFSLSTLISSIQIVNVQGVIQENLIEYLEMATNLTKFISQKKVNGEIPKWKPFQNLLFLLRDWGDESVGFKYEGGQKYLEKFLNTDGNSNNKAKLIRENIQKSFENIQCFLLNHPGLIVNKESFQGELSNLEYDFVMNLKILIESILKPENLVKKSILGKEVSSREFREFITSYFKAFKRIKLPEDENILQMMIDNQMKVIVSNQIKNYQIKINNKIDFTHSNFESHLQEIHETAKTEAVNGFLETEKLEDESSIQKFVQFLQSEVESVFRIWKDVTMRDYLRDIKHQESIKKVQTELLRQTQESINKQKEYDERMKNLQETTEKKVKYLESRIIFLNEENVKRQFNYEEQIKEMKADKDKRVQDLEACIRKEKQESIEKIKEYENMKNKQENADEDIKILKDDIQREKQESMEKQKRYEEMIKDLIKTTDRQVEDLNIDNYKQSLESIKKEGEIREMIKTQQEDTKKLRSEIAVKTKTEQENLKRIEEFMKEIEMFKNELDKRKTKILAHDDEVLVKLKAKAEASKNESVFKVFSNFVSSIFKRKK